MKKLFSVLHGPDTSFCALMAALAVYSFWGVPTPAYFGIPEFIIGILLLFVAGARGIASIFTAGPQPLWARAGQIFLLYGLSIPLILGLMEGHEISDIERDIVPFLFLLLPLFLKENIKPEHAPAVTALAAFCGWMFAARLLWPYFMAGDFSSVTDPQRLANAPTVLLCAMLLAGSAGEAIYKDASPHAIGKALLFLFAALVPLAAMILINQRASLGLMAAGLLFLLVLAFFHRPVRALMPFLAMILFIVLGWEHIAAVGQEIARKTALVGLNMRGQEMHAVLDQVGENPLTILLGKGWGAGVLSPATGDKLVTYTHNFFTTCLLKMGLAGCVMAALWLAGFAAKLWAVFRARPVVAMALAAPFLIDILLYASFKSLDFGVLLLVITLQGLSVGPAQRL